MSAPPATQSEIDGQETANNEGEMRALVHALAPPAGSVELSTSPD
jgi:hypothetical protein